MAKYVNTKFLKVATENSTQCLQNGKNNLKIVQDAQKIYTEIKQLSNLLKTIARIDNKYSKNFVSQMQISNYHNAYKLALHSVGRF